MHSMEGVLNKPLEPKISECEGFLAREDSEFWNGSKLSGSVTVLNCNGSGSMVWDGKFELGGKKQS